MRFCCGPKSTLGAVENNNGAHDCNNIKIDKSLTDSLSQFDPDCYDSETASNDFYTEKHDDEGVGMDSNDCIDFGYEDHQSDSRHNNNYGNTSQEYKVSDDGYKQNFSQSHGDDYGHLCKEQMPSYLHRYDESEINRNYGCGEPYVALSSSSECAVPRRSSLKMSGLPRRASIGYCGEVTLILPTGELKSKRTSISFVNDAENQIKEIKPVYEMVDDASRLWFQDDEYLHIKKEIYNIVKSSTNKSYKKSKSRYCTRGLENFTDVDSEETREEAKKNVIQEYLLQKARGEYDDESIRQIYTFHTIESQVKATERAKNDAKDIEKYLKSARNINRRASC